jgi:hypothetical protein
MNVDANNNVGGQITPGDLLVSSLTGGHASKADSDKLKPGMLVGKALGELRKDKGSIPVMLTIL